MEVGVGLGTVFVIILSILTYFVGKYLRICFLISKFPGPFAIPILGNTYQFKSEISELHIQFVGFMNEFREKSGGLMRIWLGPFPCLTIYGAKHMEVILSTTRYIKKGYIYQFLEPWLNKGLLTSTGEKWFHRRKMLTPTFHFSILQNFLEVFNEQSSILVKKMEKFADKPDPVNIFPHIAYCVLDIICDTAMGKHINAQGNNENEYVKAVIRMTSIITMRSLKPWTWPDFIFDKTEDGKEHARTLRILHDVTNKMIQERLHDPPKCLLGGEENEELTWKQKKRVAFLDLLLQMHRKDDRFTLGDIREEVDTFMFEGHDTTAAAAGWATLLIGLHQDVQARLHEELDQVFGKSDRPITSEDLANLSYLTCVVKETLRIIPSVPVIMRELPEDIVLGGKTVPKETMIMLDINGLHHDPEQFPDPKRFDPDRFLPEISEKRHPYAYIPFSAGPRNCIGQKFAMMEDKVIVANLLRKFSIQSVHTLAEAKPAGQLILKPVEGKILVKLSLRK